MIKVKQNAPPPELEMEQERPAFVGLNAEKSVLDDNQLSEGFNTQQSVFDKQATFNGNQ